LDIQVIILPRAKTFVCDIHPTHHHILGFTIEYTFLQCSKTLKILKYRKISSGTERRHKKLRKLSGGKIFNFSLLSVSAAENEKRGGAEPSYRD
jgi:hypothetical protein